ncbi:siderophore-iron reductase FhuF [Methylobacterium frigidaeris]|uniref:Ferric iron reductase protein FhuF n=1 Tax=Methylobacterium frigidaeris TaxID=2038277 RepID=A0AA37H9T8_9HYPH|nr:siderophore-iron reductase FhuF [Methylobacterium frigidaeris]PIK69154.1 siderophore-iron reductase FhuF [Methylobacterium frigidaeris]GJD62007.1 Ferric iron reductase protein FhuF [Methylobacterium frigidaeris]
MIPDRAAHIPDVAAHVPASLGTYRDGVALGTDGPATTPLVALRDPAVFDATLAAFEAGLGIGPNTVDRRALVSYWSQFYLAPLATPVMTALVRLGRPLPLAFATTSLELDADGRPARFLVRPAAPDGARAGLTGLVEDHLRPFVELCRAQCGIAPRVIWGNAAVILDYVARELGEPETMARPEVATCLGWRGGTACALSPLAQALCDRRRRTCCLRQRVPGVCSCGPLCPLERCRR